MYNCDDQSCLCIILHSSNNMNFMYSFVTNFQLSKTLQILYVGLFRCVKQYPIFFHCYCFRENYLTLFWKKNSKKILFTKIKVMDCIVCSIEQEKCQTGKKLAGANANNLHTNCSSINLFPIYIRTISVFLLLHCCFLCQITTVFSQKEVSCMSVSCYDVWIKQCGGILLL